MIKITKSLITVLLSFLAISCATNNSKNETETNQQEDTLVSQENVWDRSYGVVDKSYDTGLLQLRELIAPRFQTLEFNDQVTGKTMKYNLFMPKGYDEGNSYPMVFFMADTSTVGRSPKAPLMQGYGGIIWATDESQDENPCFVLVPEYTGPENVVNDEWEISDEVGITLRLIEYVISEYNINKNKLYTTGQSMGGMISFYFNANHTDLFAASLFVGSQ